MELACTQNLELVSTTAKQADSISQERLCHGIVWFKRHANSPTHPAGGPYNLEFRQEPNLELEN
jgi:hypothetical protein